MPTISRDAFNLDKLDVPPSFPHYAYRCPENIPLFAKLGPVLSLSQGHVIHDRGPSGYCYLVVAGQIGAMYHDPDGSVRQLAIFLEGSLFLESSALTGAASGMNFKAITAAKLVRIAGEDIKRAAQREDGVLQAIVKSVSMKMSAAHEMLRETTLLDVRVRIYYLLLGMASTCGEPVEGGWHTLSIKLTQQQMSEMLGVNRVTVNTALQDLYARKIADKRDGYYAVYDGKGLLSNT